MDHLPIHVPSSSGECQRHQVDVVVYLAGVRIRCVDLQLGGKTLVSAGSDSSGTHEGVGSFQEVRGRRFEELRIHPDREANPSLVITGAEKIAHYHRRVRYVAAQENCVGV